MNEPAPASTRNARSNERGFGMLDLVIGMAIMSGAVIVTASTMGMRAPKVHAAALALQTAVAEARGLALVSGDDGAADAPSGATILVAPDPAAPGATLVSVYRSRPIRNPDPIGISGTDMQSRLAVDLGFPPVHATGAFRVHDGKLTIDPPFAILVSTAGYVDLVPGYRAGDPIVSASTGCDEAAGVTVDVTAGDRTESHPLLCREATYDAAVVAQSTTAAPAASP